MRNVCSIRGMRRMVSRCAVPLPRQNFASSMGSSSSTSISRFSRCFATDTGYDSDADGPSGLAGTRSGKLTDNPAEYGRDKAFDTISVPKRRLDSMLESEITRFAMLQPNPLTLRRILSHSDPRYLAHFLSDEIPIRYAVRLKFIESLNKWETNPRLKEVHNIYLQSFKAMRMVSWDNGAEFRRMLMDVKTRHANVITLVLIGVQNLKVRKYLIIQVFQ